jgi:hypothetical protein
MIIVKVTKGFGSGRDAGAAAINIRCLEVIELEGVPAQPLGLKIGRRMGGSAGKGTLT